MICLGFQELSHDPILKKESALGMGGEMGRFFGPEKPSCETGVGEVEFWGFNEAF